MLACRHGHKEVVEILLSAGADVNFQNEVCDICDCYENNFFIFLYFMRQFCSDFDLLIDFVFLSNRGERLPSSWLVLSMAPNYWTMFDFFCIL